jgi:hypothetical protein
MLWLDCGKRNNALRIQEPKTQDPITEEPRTQDPRTKERIQNLKEIQKKEYRNNIHPSHFVFAQLLNKTF